MHLIESYLLDGKGAGVSAEVAAASHSAVTRGTYPILVALSQQVSGPLFYAWCAMTPVKIDYRARVLYIRDAAIFPSLDHKTLELMDAVYAAIANHGGSASPIIIGKGLQLVGIEAIRAMKDLDDFPRA